MNSDVTLAGWPKFTDAQERLFLDAYIEYVGNGMLPDAAEGRAYNLATDVATQGEGEND